MSDILVHEVGMRDGLQMEERVVPTERKKAWIETLLGTGVDVVQVGSFVHPTKVPQMADTDALFRHFAGPERALACGAEMVCMGVSASETHSRKNTGMGVDEARTRILAMARTALAAGKRIQVSVQSAFGCGYEGPVSRGRVVSLVKTFLDAGLRHLSLADTAGHAVPEQVEDLYAALRELDRDAEWACHFHDTYGLALANCYAALRAGVVSFEASVAGLGGCPFTAVAGGNTCTEDLVHLLQRSGRRSDVNLPALIDLARDVARFFGRDMPGSVYRTGPVPEPAAAERR
jgi:hydroxymethylglutaryl-CoA lyase